VYGDDPVPDGESTTSIEFRGRDYSYDGAMRLVEGSLKRLGVDRIDILLIHDPDDHMQEAIDGTYRALRKLRDEGVVDAIGAGMNLADKLLWLAQRGQFDCFLCAGRYTLLDQSALDELLPECDKQGIGIMIGGPYNSGLLANPYAENATFNYSAAGSEWVTKARRINEVCTRHGVSLQAAALQFPLAHPAVDTVLTGGRSIRELSQNARAFSAPIPPDLWAELKHERLLRAEAPVPR
jgi:D-threo-aldose 1-dehydrogenase